MHKKNSADFAKFRP